MIVNEPSTSPRRNPVTAHIAQPNAISNRPIIQSQPRHVPSSRLFFNDLSPYRVLTGSCGPSKQVVPCSGKRGHRAPNGLHLRGVNPAAWRLRALIGLLAMRSVLGACSTGLHRR